MEDTKTFNEILSTCLELINDYSNYLESIKDKQIDNAEIIESIDDWRTKNLTTLNLTLLNLKEYNLTPLEQMALKGLNKEYIDLLRLDKEVTDKVISYKVQERLKDNSDPKIEDVIQVTSDVLNEYNEGFKGLSEENNKQVLDTLKAYKDTGNSLITNNSLFKKLVRPKEEETKKTNALVSSKTNSKIEIQKGYLKPIEFEVLQTIWKFQLIEKQVDKEGRTYFTLAQLFRALRGNNSNPTPKEEEKLLEILKSLRSEERDIGLIFNNEFIGDMQIESGEFNILTYNKLYGKIQGRQATLIVVESPSLLIRIAEKYNTLETLTNGQRYKRIQDPNKKNGYATLTNKRIGVRNVIENTIHSYIRALNVGRYIEPKIVYETIFNKCDIKHKTDKQRLIKEFIPLVLDTYVKEGLISEWYEYKDLKGNRRGIEFRVGK